MKEPDSVNFVLQILYEIAVLSFLMLVGGVTVATANYFSPTRVTC